MSRQPGSFLRLSKKSNLAPQKVLRTFLGSSSTVRAQTASEESSTCPPWKPNSEAQSQKLASEASLQEQEVTRTHMQRAKGTRRKDCFSHVCAFPIFLNRSAECKSGHFALQQQSLTRLWVLQSPSEQAVLYLAESSRLALFVSLGISKTSHSQSNKATSSLPKRNGEAKVFQN